MPLAFLGFAMLLALGWFVYNRHQTRHRHHHRPRHHHGHKPQEEVLHRAAPLCETLDDVMQQTTSHRTEHHSNHPFHCVAVVTEGMSCSAQRAIEKRRFLSADAPTLPLKGCDSTDCQCHYQHFEDRRVPGSDRRARYGLTDELYGHFGESNRRARTKGRRSGDR